MKIIFAFYLDLQNGSRRFTPYDPIAVYRNLAAVSGGDVYVISENHNPNLATIFKVCKLVIILTNVHSFIKDACW